MSSVAEFLRRAQRARIAALSVAERIELAFRLGDRDLELFCATQHLGRAEALVRLRRARRVGRRPSRAAEGGER